MKKTHIVLVILISIALGFVLQLTLGYRLMVKLATVPFFQKLGISPEAPFVIHEKEIVKFNEEVDVGKLLTDSGLRMLSVGRKNTQSQSVDTLSSALVMTDNGVLLVSNKNFLKDAKGVQIYSSKNQPENVIQIFPDSKSLLALIATSQVGYSTVEFRNTHSLKLADRLFVSGKLSSEKNQYFQQAWVSREAGDSNVLEISTNTPILAGAGAFDSDGKLAAVYDGNTWIPSENIQQLFSDYSAQSKSK